MVVKFVVFACCAFSIGVLGLELPSFIPKCSLKDPDLNGCIKEKGNIAIPTLVKGVEEFGIPSMSPIKFPELKLGGKNLQITLSNAYTDDFKKIRITKADVNYAKGKGNFDSFIDVITVTATYSITGGKLLSRNLSGTGKFNMTLVGNKIYYKSHASLIEKDGLQYLEITNPTVDLVTDRVYYQFENLQASGEGDINEFVDKNWKVFRDELEPSIEVYLLQFINTPLQSFSKLPAHKLFN